MSKKKSLKEHLDRMKYVSKYTINETPKYKSLVGDSEIDALPEYLMKEEDKPDSESNDTDLSTTNSDNSETSIENEPKSAELAPVGVPTPEPIQSDDNSNTNVDITTANTPSEPIESPEKRVMRLQLDALEKMSSKIEDLGSTIDNLNHRMEIYSSEVDKVREPSDMEKFENRKIDSSPYYFNLNDLWKDNNFKSRMDQYSKGYIKTEDGYVADFDDIGKLSSHEVKSSFDL